MDNYDPDVQDFELGVGGGVLSPLAPSATELLLALLPSSAARGAQQKRSVCNRMFFMV